MAKKKNTQPQLRFKDDEGKDYPDWEVKTLGRIGSFYSGGTPLTSNKEYYDGKIPFIKSGENQFSQN